MIKTFEHKNGILRLLQSSLQTIQMKEVDGITYFIPQDYYSQYRIRYLFKPELKYRLMFFIPFLLYLFFVTYLFLSKNIKKKLNEFFKAKESINVSDYINIAIKKIPIRHLFGESYHKHIFYSVLFVDVLYLILFGIFRDPPLILSLISWEVWFFLITPLMIIFFYLTGAIKIIIAYSFNFIKKRFLQHN